MQTSMKKGCAVGKSTPDHPQGTAFLNTPAHKRGIIAGYYAMVAEYDDMVGAYVSALKEAGLEESTVLILTSDHGDMQMQHQQFYKMVAYEASSRVPCVMAGPGITPRGNVLMLASLVDVMPTLLELGKVPLPTGEYALDGTSLVPLLQTGDAAAASHPDHVVSQFHGENLAMSWYMIRRAEMKLIQWGTGVEHPPQLFNLTADPDEMTNLALKKPNHALLLELDALLRKAIPYPAVSIEVAKYNIAMAKWWMNDEPQWRAILAGTANSTNHGGPQTCLSHICAKGGSDWGEVWQVGTEAGGKYMQAWHKWIESEPAVVPCPASLTFDWPK